MNNASLKHSILRLSKEFFTLILITFVLCSTHAEKVGNVFIPCDRSEFLYETDGHYWTVLVVATLLNLPDAKTMAYSAEYPDNVINADGYCVRRRITFMYPKAQERIHALTGGNPQYERTLSANQLKQATTAAWKGVAAHRLGDSFAHTNDKTGRMYPHLIGHTLHWKTPDKIRNNPNKYLQYVYELVAALGGPDALIDMSVFNYIAAAGLNTDANSSILKAEYSLLTASPAFNIDHKYSKEVNTYLSQRLSKELRSFVTHSETDNKGKVINTIILTDFVTGNNPQYLPTEIPGNFKKGTYRNGEFRRGRLIIRRRNNNHRNLRNQSPIAAIDPAQWIPFS